MTAQLSSPATPVTIERLSEVFDLLAAEYTIINKSPADQENLSDPEQQVPEGAADTVLQTGLPHMVIHFDVEEDILSAFATWEGHLPVSTEDSLAAAIADLNWSLPVPTLSYVVDSDAATGKDHLLVGANRAMGVAEGLTLNQLGSFVVSSMSSFGHVFDLLTDLFPQAAPWKETHDC